MRDLRLDSALEIKKKKRLKDFIGTIDKIGIWTAQIKNTVSVLNFLKLMTVPWFYKIIALFLGNTY